MIEVEFKDTKSEVVPVRLYYLPNHIRHSLVIIQIEVITKENSVLGEITPLLLVIKSKYFGYSKILPKRSGQFYLRDPEITLIEGDISVENLYKSYPSSILEVPKEDIIKTIRLVSTLNNRFKYFKTINVI